MRLLPVTVLLAAMLTAAGCSSPPSARVPGVVTARQVGNTVSTTAPLTDTNAVAPGRESVDGSGEPTGAAREQTPAREVVAPHVDEREDEEAQDTAPKGDGE